MYILVMGAGTTGFPLISSLVSAGHEVLAIEPDRASADAVRDRLGNIVINGDASGALSGLIGSWSVTTSTDDIPGILLRAYGGLPGDGGDAASGSSAKGGDGGSAGAGGNIKHLVPGTQFGSLA